MVPPAMSRAVLPGVSWTTGRVLCAVGTGAGAYGVGTGAGTVVWSATGGAVGAV